MGYTLEIQKMLVFLIVLSGLFMSLGFVAMNAVTIRQRKPLAAALMFAGALLPVASLLGSANLVATLLVGVVVWAAGAHLYYPNPA